MAIEETRCDILAKNQAKMLKSMLQEQLNSAFNQTGVIKDGVIEDVTPSKGSYTRMPAGVPVVYTGNPNAKMGQQASERDVFEMANKQRPYMCRVTYNPKVISLDSIKTAGTLDCFSFDDQVGPFFIKNLKNNRKDIRDLVRFANDKHGTNDRKQWSNWERALLHELLDQRERFKYVVSTPVDSAGHEYLAGSLSNMIVEHCHAIVK